MDDALSTTSSVTSLSDGVPPPEFLSPCAGDKFLEVHGVRIYPRCVQLANPFEGKKYEIKITITNSSKSPVAIRILKCTSSLISCKPIMREQVLAPGLSIIRILKYTVAMATLISECFIPIFINEEIEPILYKIEVIPSRSYLIVDPRYVDFGIVDAGRITQRRTITLNNIGTKPTKFYVDVRRSDINVEPTRGFLEEKATITLHIELNLREPGHYHGEFWVVSENPLMVKIKAISIHGCLELIDCTTLAPNLAYIQFPVTYYGVQCCKSIKVMNKSQSNSFFCVTGEYKGNLINLNDAKEIDPMYSHLTVTPSSGRLLPRDRRAFSFVFNPDKSLANVYGKNMQFLTVMNIHKVPFKDLDTNQYAGEVFVECQQDISTTDLKSIRLDSVYQFCSDFEETTDFESYVSENDFDLIETCITIYLFADVEIPSVSAIPDEIVLKNIKINKTMARTIILKNESEVLPIIFRYKKIAYVEISPKTALLKPLEKLEISVLITPKSFNTTDSFIEMELMYGNSQYADQKMDVIGNTKIHLRLKPKIESSKNDCKLITAKTFDFKKPNIKPKLEIYNRLVQEDALLALPNYNERLMLPNHEGKTCKTIFAAMPAFIPRKISENQYSSTILKFKKQNKDYYTNFVRNYSKKEIPVEKFYELKERTDCNEIPMELQTSKVIKSYYIPLSPLELNNIIIEPRSVYVSNIVSHSIVTREFKIMNKNSIPIRVYLRPHKLPFFGFPNGNRAEIQGHSEKRIPFCCNSDRSGLNRYVLDIIINENHIFETVITLNVSARLLNFNTYSITFEPNKPLWKTLEVTNGYNADIEFNWEYVGDFKIYPMKAVVTAGNQLTCYISYEIGKTTSHNCELIVKIDEKKIRIINVTIIPYNFNICINQNIDFGNVGLSVLNIRTEMLQNKSEDCLSYKINEETIPPGVTVYPMKGFLSPYGIELITFNFQCSKLGLFENELEIVVSYMYRIKITITAFVKLPNITITPSIIKFRKMHASSFDVACFQIQNGEGVTASIKFDTERFEDLHFSEYTDSEYITNNDEFILNENSQKTFLIHYYPFYSLVTTFHLPIIINGIGFLDPKRILYGLETIKLYSKVLSHRLILKNWKYNFYCYPSFQFKSQTQHTISISAKVFTKFYIAIKQDVLPFTFTHVSGGVVFIKPDYMCIEIGPDEEIIFLATFCPNSPGNFELKLPVHIKDDVADDIHNYIHFYGVYHEPIIQSPLEELIMGYIPLNITIQREAKIELNYHYPSCEVHYFCSDLNIQITKPENFHVKSMFETVNILVTYESKEFHVLNTVININCNCGAIFNLKCYGGTDNCFLTNYSSYMYFKLSLDIDFLTVRAEKKFVRGSTPGSITIANTPKFLTNSCYPFYPSSGDKFNEFMDEIVRILEKWINEQGFFGANYEKIPDMIRSYKLVEVMTYKSSTYIGGNYKLIKLPYQHLIQNICGSVARFGRLTLHKHDLLYVRIYNYYAEVLEFLQSLEAVVTAIQPQYLLPYGEYRMYCEENNRDMLNLTLFNLRSKQSWIDFLLQTYKVLILQRVSNDPSYMKISERECSTRSSLLKLSSMALIEDNYHSYLEYRMLQWINYSLEVVQENLNDFSKIFVVTSKFKLIFPFKQVHNFEEDLSDCLGFAAVTLRHCPFLIKYFRTFYLPPKNPPECFHNACLLTKAWSNLQITFSMTPFDIINPNPIQMLLFTNYLLEVLPALTPADPIIIKSLLNGIKTQVITIENEHSVTLYYSATFINDEENLFSVDETNIMVLPKRDTSITITYHAKFAKRSEVVLYLCGEVKGHRYISGKMFPIIGTPLYSNPNEIIVLKSPLYTVESDIMTLASPYPMEAEYEIFYGIEKTPKSYNYKFIPYSELKQICQFSRFQIESHIAYANKEGRIKILIRTCSIIRANSTFIIFFKNSQVGDFFIKVILSTIDIVNCMKIVLPVQKDFYSSSCICKNENDECTKCPRYLSIPIQARNLNLWNSIVKLKILISDETEAEFWKLNQDTKLGINLLKRILQDSETQMDKDMMYVYKDTVKFEVLITPTNSVTSQKWFKIENATSVNEVVHLKVHINEQVPVFSIKLESNDGYELRFYKVYIIPEL